MLNSDETFNSSHIPYDSKILNKIVFLPYGKCIYCGMKNPSTDEHIIPFGLSGDMILKNASCTSCAKITSKIEQDILRGPFLGVRLFRRLKSRNGHKKTKIQVLVRMLKNDFWQDVLLAVEDAPNIIPFPNFMPPRIITGATESEQHLIGKYDILFGKSPLEVCKEQGASSIEVKSSINLNSFSRFIAKIGYSYGCALGVMKDLENPQEIVEAIFRTDNSIEKWVGGCSGPTTTPGHLYHLNLHYDFERRIAAVEVQIFADSETPSYLVVLGTLRNGVCKAPAFPAQEHKKIRDYREKLVVPPSAMNLLGHNFD